MTSGVGAAVSILAIPIVFLRDALAGLFAGRARHPYAPAGPTRAMRLALSAQAAALAIGLLYDPKLNPSLSRVPDELKLPPDTALILIVSASVAVLMISLHSQGAAGLAAVAIGFVQVSLTTGTVDSAGSFLAGTGLLYLLASFLVGRRFVLALVTMFAIFVLVEGYWPTRLLD